jgi:hypothetical protein
MDRVKVRWTEESVRLRITPSELEALTGGIPVHVRLGTWTVTLAPGEVDLRIDWNGSDAIVRVSAADVAQLAEPDREGIYAHSSSPRLLVEKDFPCRHPHSDEAHEPETDRFAPTPSFLERKDAPASDQQ